MHSLILFCFVTFTCGLSITLFGLNLQYEAVSSVRLCRNYTSCYSSSQEINNITNVTFIAFHPQDMHECDIDKYVLDGFYSFFAISNNTRIERTVMYGESFSQGIQYLCYLSFNVDMKYGIIRIL